MSTPTKKPPHHVSQLSEDDLAKVGTSESPLLLPWVDKFLEGLSKSGVVTVAAKHAGISRDTAYDLRARDPSFASKWESAVQESIDVLEATARNRAINGTKRSVVNKGKVVMVKNAQGIDEPLTEVKHSDALTIFLLKKYRYPDQVQHVGPGGGPIQHQHLHAIKPANKVGVMEGVARMVQNKLLAPPATGEVIDLDETILADTTGETDERERDTGGEDTDAMREAGE